MNRLFTYLQLILIVLACISSISLSAQTSGTITGTISTSEGTPAAAITVVIKELNKSALTSENGTFTIKNLRPGSYTIKTAGLGLLPQEKTITINSREVTTVSFSLSESAEKLSEVVVTGYKTPNQKPANVGKAGIAPKDMPQSVQVINREVITDQQADRLGDIMKNVNGVALGANRGAVGDNFYARGYSLGSNNVFKNGARTSIGGSPEASTLESVEVLKGSAALLYGGVTGGAVVNMVTKKPKFEYGGEVSMRTGSYDQYKPAIDLYGPISKKLAVRAISTYEKAGSFRDNVSTQRFYVNPSLLYKAGPKTNVLIQGDYLKSDFTPDFGVGSVESKIVDFGREKFLNTPWAYNNTNTATGQLNVDHKFAGTWTLNVIGSFQSYKRDYFGSERLQANAAGTSARNVNRAKTDEYTYNQQLNLTGIVYTGKIKHTVLVGLDADQSRITSNAFNYINEKGELAATFNYGNVNVFDPATYYGTGVMPEAVAISKTVSPVYRYGAFIQDLVEITDQFKVLAGIRYTDQKNARATTTKLADGTQAKTASKSDNAFSPKLGLIYQPLSSTSLYVSYANNFIANTGTDIYDKALPPSIVNQYEAGVKNDFLSGRLSANFTYYKVINNNIAQIAEFGANGEPNSNSAIKQLNGETTSDGLELDLSGTLLPGLNFIAGYSYNFMRYTNTAAGSGMIEDVRLVGTTKNTANATLFYTVQNGRIKGLKLGASTFYTGERNGGWNDTKAATTLRLIPIKAFTTIDLSAGYSWKKFSLLTKISNITDELSYYVHENYSVNPIPPRQFVSTLSYRF